MASIESIPREKFPRHIAVIMDGNGRWAVQRGLERIRGHQEGAKTVRRIVTECARLRKHQNAVLNFLEDLRVDFANDYVAYCTPSAWLRCLLKLTFIFVMRVFVGWWEQHDPTAISVVHGNASSSPPIPDRLWRHSIGLSGFSGG